MRIRSSRGPSRSMGLCAGVLGMLLAAPVLAQSFQAGFETPGGNEWWVEAYVTANEPLAGVDARADGGAWQPLTLRSWGAWAASFFVGDGAAVEFRARSEGGATVVSDPYLWPEGTPVPDGGGGGGGDAFAASFTNVRGNGWWVETDVQADAPLAGVDARVDGGAWQALSTTSWGSWARSLFVPDGAAVEFRARSTTGESAISGAYLWPDATPIDGGGGEPPPDDGGEPPPDDGGGALAATFSGVRGNTWWVEAEVDANEALQGVDARVDGGAWQALSFTEWGSWARSLFAPSGSVVEFRARSTSGASALSGGYLWPDATPVDGGGGEPPPDGGGEEPPPPPPPSGSDVVVSIDASAGPHGAPAPVVVDRGLYSMNIADWKRSDYDPPNPDFLAYLQALEPGYLRWPAGERSQQYNWSRGGPGQTGIRTITPDHVDAFIALCDAVGAEPLFGINLKTGTPEAAADLVRYLNVEQGYGVTWFQLGNEPDFSGTPSPEVHVERHNAFADAMLAVDPGIRFVGPELLTGAHVLGHHGTTNWMAPFLQGASPIDGVSWHWYPLWSEQDNPNSSGYFALENLYLESAPDWHPASIGYADEIMPALQGEIDVYAPGAGIWITEYAIDSGGAAGAGLADTLAGALWAADSLGRFAAWGPAAIVRWIFSSTDEHRYALIDTAFDARPQYYTYWLYARQWGDRVVSTTSDDVANVNAHAALRDDGALAVMLVNKSGSTRTVALSVAGFSPGSAERYVIEGAGLSDTTVTLNGQTLTPGAALDETIAAEAVPSGEVLEVVLPPYTVELRVLR